MASSKKKYLKPGEKVVLSLMEEEADQITKLPLISEELLHMIYISKMRDGIVSARYTLSELEELSECIAAEANNMKHKKLRKQLDAISEKIDQLNLKYYDDDSPQEHSQQKYSQREAIARRKLVLVKK